MSFNGKSLVFIKKKCTVPIQLGTARVSTPLKLSLVRQGEDREHPKIEEIEDRGVINNQYMIKECKPRHVSNSLVYAY